MWKTSRLWCASWPDQLLTFASETTTRAAAAAGRAAAAAAAVVVAVVVVAAAVVVEAAAAGAVAVAARRQSNCQGVCCHQFSVRSSAVDGFWNAPVEWNLLKLGLGCLVFSVFEIWAICRCRMPEAHTYST